MVAASTSYRLASSREERKKVSPGFSRIMPSNFFLLLLSLASDFAYRISSGVLPTERTPRLEVLGGTELRAFVPNFIRLAQPTDGQRSRVVACRQTVRRPRKNPCDTQQERLNCGDAITTNVTSCQAASVSASPPIISFFDSLYHFCNMCCAYQNTR
jgi:hypothetical protein